MKKRCLSFMRSGSLLNVYGGKFTGFWCTLVLLLLGAVSAVNSASLFASATPQISGGEWYSLALKSDGTVWTWGGRDLQVRSLSGAIAVAAGKYHRLALKSDGTVWAWGDNEYGQLGDGTSGEFAGKYTPVQVISLSGVIAVAAGWYHSLAVKSDGTVWAWGYNRYGRLGDGSTTQRDTPVQVSGLSGVIAVAGGWAHSLALKSDGTVWAWGFNEYGQLGDGTSGEFEGKSTPVQVIGLSGVIAIAGGEEHSLALKSDGTVWAWGSNGDNQLGDGTHGELESKSTPVQVISLSGVIAIAGGEDHSLALKSDGTVWAWGYNGSGRLGDGTTDARLTPVQVSGLSGVIAVGAGNKHSLAVKSDGTVWAWGYNGSGQLGDGTTSLGSGTPVQVRNINLYVTTTTTISIDVEDSNGDPIGSVKIKLKGKKTKLSKTGTTDEYGFVEFTDLKADTYLITAELTGYKKAKKTVKVKEGEFVGVYIQMK